MRKFAVELRHVLDVVVTALALIVNVKRLDYYNRVKAVVFVHDLLIVEFFSFFGLD